MVTADGEVQTNEVQVYLHDLHTFVTVQLLEDTPAVFSLGKLCKEHDYTYEWPSDRGPRLTQNGNQTLNRTKNFVPLVGPGLSSSSTTASSSTSPPQDLSVSLDPANTLSNEGSTGNCSEGVAGHCSEGIPEWVQDFTENLEIAETLAAAEISHDSDLERPTKVAPKNHNIYVHFPKDRNCEVCLRTKMTRTLCRRRTGEAVPRAEKFGNLIEAAHKVLNEGCD